MAPKEPTRAQLSSRLLYQSHKPAFLLKLENKIAGVPEEEDQDEEFEHVGGGREPIPRRPQRPKDDRESSDEEHGDEKPVIVVLKKGKHMTEREVENARRKEKGLPPLPDPDADNKSTEQAPSEEKDAHNKKSRTKGLTFSSSSKTPSKSFAKKRKIIPQVDDEQDAPSKKKNKKSSQALLSFDDDV